MTTRTEELTREIEQIGRLLETAKGADLLGLIRRGAELTAERIRLGAGSEAN